MKSRFVSALLILLAAPFGAIQAQSAPPVAGTDYIEIPNGSPLDPVEGVVVVEEFFNYICPACNSFEPLFVAWAAQLPPYAKLVHVPATFRADFAPYAKAYYAAESFGLVEKTHRAVYEAIHVTRKLPAEGDPPNEDRVAAFYADFGVDKAAFLGAMQSFGVGVKLRSGTEHMKQSKVPSTPSLLINGRYLVRGRTYADMLRIASFLIEKEHAG